MSIVYILTNEAMPGLIKIGRTNTSVEQRLSELNRHAGIPLPFECYYAAKVSDSVFVERKLHEAFDDNRVRQQREFFRLSPYKAQCALEIGAIEDVTPRDEIFDEDPKDAASAVEKEINRREVFSFAQYGIPNGAELRFTRNSEITAIVNGDRTINFRNETQSMSKAALTLLHEMGYRWRSARGGAYWEYEGQTVMDLGEKLRGNLS